MKKILYKAQLEKEHEGMSLLAFLRLQCKDISVKYLKLAIDTKLCAVNGIVENFSTHPLNVGDVVVRVGGIEVVRNSISKKASSITSFGWTPYFTGETTISLEGSNLSRIMYIFDISTSVWEQKAGILTIYATDSNGVGY